MGPLSIFLFFNYVLICAKTEENVRGKRLKIVTIEQAPFVMRNKDSDGYHGYLIEMLKYLQEQMGFHYDVYLVPDGKFGLKNGDKWSGMIGELMDEKADMALAPLTITHQRQKVVDFTKPFLHVNIAILSKNPEPGYKLPFRSLLELVGTGIKYGPIEGGSTRAIFSKDSNYQLYREMDRQLATFTLPSTYSEAVEMVRNESFAFVGESTMLDFWLGRQPCDLMKTPTDIHKSYALAFPLGTPYARLFSPEVLKMRENGAMHLLKAKWWVNDCQGIPKLCMCGDKEPKDEN